MSSNIQLILESSSNLASKKLFKVENFDEILNSSKERITSFLHSCPDPKVWLLVVVSAKFKFLYIFSFIFSLRKMNPSLKN